MSYTIKLGDAYKVTFPGTLSKIIASIESMKRVLVNEASFASLGAILAISILLNKIGILTFPGVSNSLFRELVIIAILISSFVSSIISINQFNASGIDDDNYFSRCLWPFWIILVVNSLVIPFIAPWLNSYIVLTYPLLLGLHAYLQLDTFEQYQEVIQDAEIKAFYGGDPNVK